MERWQSFPLLETLAASAGLQTSPQNDAIAERMNGVADGLDHAVSLYLG